MDSEGFGTCGLYFESVYPLVEETTTAADCIPGATFRRKFYSLSPQLASFQESGMQKPASIVVGGTSRETKEVAGMLVTFGFAAVRRCKLETLA